MNNNNHYHDHQGRPKGRPKEFFHSLQSFLSHIKVLNSLFHRSSIFKEVLDVVDSTFAMFHPPLVPRIPVCLLFLPHGVHSDMQVSFSSAESCQKFWKIFPDLAGGLSI